MNQQDSKFSIKAVTALKIQNLNYHTGHEGIMVSRDERRTTTFKLNVVVNLKIEVKNKYIDL